jgi:hypothetical protein
VASLCAPLGAPLGGDAPQLAMPSKTTRRPAPPLRFGRPQVDPLPGLDAAGKVALPAVP